MKTRFEVDFFDFQVDPSTVQWHQEGFLKGPNVEFPTPSAKTKQKWRKSTATKAQSLQFTFTHKEKVHMWKLQKS